MPSFSRLPSQAKLLGRQPPRPVPLRYLDAARRPALCEGSQAGPPPKKKGSTLTVPVAPQAEAGWRVAGGGWGEALAVLPGRHPSAGRVSCLVATRESQGAENVWKETSRGLQRPVASWRFLWIWSAAPSNFALKCPWVVTEGDQIGAAKIRRTAKWLPRITFCCFLVLSSVSPGL